MQDNIFYRITVGWVRFDLKKSDIGKLPHVALLAILINQLLINRLRINLLPINLLKNKSATN